MSLARKKKATGQMIGRLPGEHSQTRAAAVCTRVGERLSLCRMSYELTRRIGSEISGAFNASGALGGDMGMTGTGGPSTGGAGIAC
jgi:hypothetical protein